MVLIFVYARVNFSPFLISLKTSPWTYQYRTVGNNRYHQQHIVDARGCHSHHSDVRSSSKV